ncbi:CGGC domain-containing protein [Aminipila butyrica]|uniref:CGGC domain-containing protein n=1 Tax=Aminipila butyrica TaxID=433296 RepID=A0A858BXB7_9FIRM|nr:CGGC domain-containing protein [Aminipila butyrica]QIB69540.1 CGGC domain-containing protein [Aminipila butyrica]
METKYVIVIQCDIVRRRCSGFACTNTFYNREDSFKDKDYDENVRYIPMTCGGCCGAGLASLLEHFSKRSAKQNGLKKEEVVVHLSSCMVTENYHHDRCPHIDYIKALVKKKGYSRIVEGTYISQSAEKKRAAGIYKTY